MKTTKLLIGAVALAAAFASAKAQAQNLTATLTGVTPGLGVNGTYDNKNYEDIPSGVAAFTDFDAFCIEPLQPVQYGETLVYQVQNPQSLANYDTIARLVSGYLASPQTDADAAAVQWAIWETVLDGPQSASFSSGNSRISSSGKETALLASRYLANVPNFAPVTLTYLTNGTRQDMVTWNMVPEPTSLGLVALSGVLLVARRRRL